MRCSPTLKQSAIYSDCDGTKSRASFVPLDAKRFDDQPRGRSPRILLLSGHEAAFTHSMGLEATATMKFCIINLSRFIFDAKRLVVVLDEPFDDIVDAIDIAASQGDLLQNLSVLSLQHPIEYFFRK